MRTGRVALITGGAGFIGTNLAHRLMSEGTRVRVFDNLSRAGVRTNLEWLAQTHPGEFAVQAGDVRDAAALKAAVAQADEVYHLAAQVAVTTSVSDPVQDFEVNARGTLNLLEALRARTSPPPLLYTSTNKVYGALPDIRLTRTGSRYAPEDARIRSLGISELRPLDFHSPYGCSKGCADQYILDYARTYGLPAAVFRMSCIYGPHQQGNEDQGWVAHFLIRARDKAPLAVFGDGLQVRDVLYVDDLVEAFRLAMRKMPGIAGEAYNIGGGPEQTLSLRELLAHLQDQGEFASEVTFERPRPGDQRYYVSDTTKFSSATGWHPAVPVREGLRRLTAWLTESCLPGSASGPLPERAPTSTSAAVSSIGAAR
jgi:CDP-paratose 2-epimerase